MAKLLPALYLIGNTVDGKRSKLDFIHIAHAYRLNYL